MDGKAWITGQNWIDLYQRNCARCGLVDTIGQFTDGHSVYEFINDSTISFDCDNYVDNDRWVRREWVAETEQYKICR